MSFLEQLREYTVIVVDTGDIESIKQFQPRDATTNPSLILQASQNPQYKRLIDDALQRSNKKKDLFLDLVFVNFGLEILKVIPGRVSTEVDARLSFDTNASIARARHIISLYEAAGIKRDRILIKLATTWEGIRAAEILEKEGIHCNMTLLFSLIQAVAAAKAKATLISPFVGRILDWYKKHDKVESYPQEKDPGVLSVRDIYYTFKHFGYKTEIMGASFRNIGEIEELAGCDLLTIAPNLLAELSNKEGSLTRKLDPNLAANMPMRDVATDENNFRWELNENPMATDKLAEGIRKFADDIVKLEKAFL